MIVYVQQNRIFFTFSRTLKSKLLNREHFANGLWLFLHSLGEREEDEDNDSEISVAKQIAEILSQLFQIDYIT